MQKTGLSIIVPVRNEAGMIEEIVSRIPDLAIPCELIFIEGHSTDATLAAVQAVAKHPYSRLEVRYDRQPGIGKADAVWHGFSLARYDKLIVLDADLTVRPEDLPLFYQALCGQPEALVIGSRLHYPMEPGAMRRFNYIGNRLFAMLLSLVTGARMHDTLCGTKALSKSNFERIKGLALFQSKRDPFGDFTFILGAAKLGMPIIEVPIVYYRRRYGTTKIRRFRDGWTLLQVVALFLWLKLLGQ